MPSLDLRPSRLDIAFRPGNSFQLEITGPAGWLGSRSFTALLGDQSLTVTENSDLLTVAASAVITEDFTEATTWSLTDNAGDEWIVGHATPKTEGALSNGDEINLTYGPAEIDLTVIGTGSGAGGAPSGAAGGVLSGTYPNPGFAADMATQAELDAVAATIPTTEVTQDLVGAMFSGNTETGIAATYDDTAGKIDLVAEVTQAELDAVSGAIPNTEAIQDIVGAMVTGGTETGIAVTYDDTNARLDFVAEVTQAEIDALSSTYAAITEPIAQAHIDDATAAHSGTAIANTPAGNISATTVQAAIDELDTEKQPLDSDLTAIAGLSPSNDDVVQRKAGAWTNRTIAQLLTDLAAPGTTFQPLDADLTAVAALTTTAFGRALLELANAGALRTAAGLGSMATETATDYVAKALYDAHTVLVATSDNTPAAVTMGASTILARLASGNIVAATPSELRTLLALVVGTNVQAWDADLDAVAALTSAANKIPYATGAQAWALADYTAVARTFDALSTLLAQQQYVMGAQAFNAQTGTTYTLASTDPTKHVTLSNASAITLTVPQDSDVTWAVGDWCDISQLGAGQVTVVAGTGATLRLSGPTAKLAAQYARGGLQKISANTWQVYGYLAAS